MTTTTVSYNKNTIYYNSTNKTHNVRITWYWGTFVQPMLLWKSNMYCILWVCVCNLRNPVCKCMHHIVIRWMPPALQILPTLSHKWHHILKNVIAQKMSVSIFSTNFVWNIFHSKKKWVRYDQNSTLVDEWKTKLMSLATLFHLLCAEACKTSTTKYQPQQKLQHTTNWEQDNRCGNSSTQLLKMDILMSETCWAHKKWNKIESDIKLVFHSSTIAMMHGPINIRSEQSFVRDTKSNVCLCLSFLTATTPSATSNVWRQGPEKLLP